ncbi:MAG: FkbM family methyltransferase, partial [Thaumarchaeota archaeon]
MLDLKWILKYRILNYPKPTEPEVTKIMLSMKGNLFIDIGSNTGWFSRILKNNFNNIITIDANPKWKANMRIAISNFDGEGVFFIGNNLGSADSLKNNPYILGKDWINIEQLRVKVCRFDTLKLDADLVKVDVEGSEFDVLEGMKEYVPKKIVVELH